MELEKHKTIIENIKFAMGTRPEFKHLQALVSEAQHLYADYPEQLGLSLKLTNYAKSWALPLYADNQDPQVQELYWLATLFEAPHLFESYLYYMERYRDPKKRFYQPRRRTLGIVAKDLQDLEDRKYDFYGLSLIPRSGKSTLCIFFMAWIMGKRPNSHNAMSGHSGVLADGFYDETLNLITTKEYAFGEIFPFSRLQKKNAEKKEINLDKPDRFASLTCRGIDGTFTGAVDVSSDGYLYVDDLVRDRMESLSPVRLENRYQDYLNVLVDRKNDGARELMVGTRWNVFDPLGRIEAQYKDNPRYKFRKIPALNEQGESNFVYDYGKGFSTEYFVNLKHRLDRNEFEAKYQQRPFVREGLILPEDELRYYNGVLPDGDFRIVSAVDVAWGGGDSLSMPIGAEYSNGDVYIFDWVFNRGRKEETLPIVLGKIIGNGITQINFEANNGGNMYRHYIDEKLKEKGYKCSTTDTKAPNNMAKMTKIVACSGDIKNKFIFLSREKQPAEYKKAMDELCTTVQVGKNEHDDAIDSLAQLSRYLEGGFGISKVQVIQRPF